MILYKLSRDVSRSTDEKSFVRVIKKWVYVGYSRAHTHDVRALTVAVPISREGDFGSKSSVCINCFGFWTFGHPFEYLSQTC